MNNSVMLEIYENLCYYWLRDVVLHLYPITVYQMF